MPNQNKPTPPKELLEPFAREYHSWGVTHAKLLSMLKEEFDTERFGLGTTTLKKWLAEWGLQSARKQAHTFESISGPIQRLQKKFPTAGARGMRDHLRMTHGIRVPKKLISDYNTATDPLAVQARKASRMRRRIFYAAGVNHIWAFDQHDKWQRYGLRHHIGVEPFTGRILWLIIWWNNSDPKVPARQYFKAIRETGGLPMLTHSDRGTENYNIAYAQTHMRQELDDDLDGTLQHRWMRGHTNIKPERAWGRLRDTWSKGYEDMLNVGVKNQWYNASNTLDSLTFRWLAIPFFQKELDDYVVTHNTTARRANKHKVLPQGIPEFMFRYPHTVDALDFKIIVPSSLLDQAEEKWAPCDDPIFQLVPPAFQAIVSKCYDSLGQPEVTFDAFWDIYRGLRDEVEAATPDNITAGLDQTMASEPVAEDPFALAHLKPPEINARNVVDVEDWEGGDSDVFTCEFTVDNDRDQLY